MEQIFQIQPLLYLMVKVNFTTFHKHGLLHTQKKVKDVKLHVDQRRLFGRFFDTVYIFLNGGKKK
jgi:hypothetical protein